MRICNAVHSSASELKHEWHYIETKKLIRTLDKCLKRVKILFGLSQLDKDSLKIILGNRVILMNAP